jgi:hypothetical protein
MCEQGKHMDRDRNVHSLVQDLLDRSHMNVQTHTGTTLLQAKGHILVPQV